jgi:tRNA A-37 threonylcarbamoyl transferase component Bud32
VTKTLYPSLEVLLFLLFSPAIKMRQTALDSLDSRPVSKHRAASRRLRKPRSSAVDKSGSHERGERVSSPRMRGAAISKDELAETQVLSEEMLTQLQGQANEQPPQGYESFQNVPGLNTPVMGTGTAEALASGPPTPGQRGSAASSTPFAVNQDGTPLQLGRYEVLELVGQGAMGSVYKGKDPTIGRLVALKTIRFEHGKSEEELEELRERFYREARAAGNLSHPNIVTVYDVGGEGDLQYIAMEFLEGHTLVEIVKNKRALNYKIMAKIIMQVCSALDYAHKQGVIHRDIKPANIMVLKNFEIKVADFGIARLDKSNMTLTQTGMAMGTPNYIAPEQLKGERVDARSDIFSLGVVIYELLTHKRPFTGENISQLIYSILNAEPEKPSSIDENIPGIFDMVTTRCLAKDPFDRYQTAGEIAADLVDFVSSFGAKSFKI